MKHKYFKLKLILILLFCAPIALASKISIGAGSEVRLGSASLYSDTLNVENSGMLFWGSGNHQIFSFHNLSMAESSAQNSYISVLQDWENLNNFFADSGTVEFLDLFPISQIIGDTEFFNLIAATAIDKSLILQVDSTQGIFNNLVLTGVAGNLLKIRSSSISGVANIKLNGAASQTVDYVDVEYNHGIAQHIAPGSAASYNSVFGQRVRGWFSINLQYTIPTLNFYSLLVLLIMLLLFSKKHIEKIYNFKIKGE